MKKLNEAALSVLASIAWFASWGASGCAMALALGLACGLATGQEAPATTPANSEQPRPADGAPQIEQQQQQQPEEESPAKTPLEMLDVFQLEFVADPQVSPDGTQVVYVRRFYDIMTDRGRGHLWIYTADGQHQPLLTGEANYHSPRWSPDGTRLAYVTRENGSEQIFCLWLATGRTTALTRLTSSPSNLAWAPDGRSLAFNMSVKEAAQPFAKMPAKPEGAQWAEPAVVIDRLKYRADGGGYLDETYSHLHLLRADGGTPRQLTRGKFDHGPACWAPDGNTLYFSANRNPESEFVPRDSNLYALAIDTGRLTQLTDRVGPDTNPVATPDGNWIYYLGYDEKMLGQQNNRLYRITPDGSTQELVLGDFAYSPSSIAWSDKDNGIVFFYDARGEGCLGFVNAEGKETQIMTSLGGTTLGRPYSSGSFSVSPSGAIAFTLGDSQSPARLAWFYRGHFPETLVDLNEDLLSQRQLGTVHELEFASSADGREIQGWYVTPPDFDPTRKYPLILEIHGGPYANYGPRFSAEMQLYAAAGYVVLYINPRGSTSYGEEFANLIQHAYPGQDYDDLISGVDALLELGFVDPENLFVTGGSGGGVLTAWIVGKTDRFRAAVVAKPVINWFSFALTADSYNYFYQYWFPGPPWEHTEHYMQRSPISLVGNVQTPTMLLTGEADYRTPISETEQYYQALKLRKVDTVMVRIPNASHGITARPSNLIAKVSHILEWFERYRQKSDR